MFVIQVIDENGACCKKELPLYSGRFSDEDMWKLLKEYLEALNVRGAKTVQVLADGAPWIWNKIEPLLIELGVPKEKIVLCLDYYHASQYVHKIAEALPESISREQRAKKLVLFKKWLWEGNCGKIVTACSRLIKHKTEDVQRWLNYLEKHENKTQYAEYERNKLKSGSGIVESGINSTLSN